MSIFDNNHHTIQLESYDQPLKIYILQAKFSLYFGLIFETPGWTCFISYRKIIPYIILFTF